MNPRVQYRCSFCDKSQEKVHRLVAGPRGVYICNECADLCVRIMGEDGQKPDSQLIPDSSEQEQLRNGALTVAHTIHRLIATRDYTNALAQAETMVERLQHLTRLQPGESDGRDLPGD